MNKDIGEVMLSEEQSPNLLIKSGLVSTRPLVYYPTHSKF